MKNSNLLIGMFVTLFNISLSAYEHDKLANSNECYIDNDQLPIEEEDDDESFSSVEDDVSLYEIFSITALDEVFFSGFIEEKDKKTLESEFTLFFSSAKSLEEILPTSSGTKEAKQLVSNIKNHEQNIVNILNTERFLVNENMEIRYFKEKTMNNLHSAKKILTELFCDWGLN